MDEKLERFNIGDTEILKEIFFDSNDSRIRIVVATDKSTKMIHLLKQAVITVGNEPIETDVDHVFLLLQDLEEVVNRAKSYQGNKVDESVAGTSTL